jgi:hypothetical protein
MPYFQDRTRLYKNDIAKRINRSVRSLDNWVKAGKFPHPLRDEYGRPFWWSDDVARHEAELAQRLRDAA